MTDNRHHLATTASQAFDLAAVIAYVRLTTTGWRLHASITGITNIHQWLSAYPGATWQEKWVAADGDSHVEDAMQQAFEAAYPPGTEAPKRSTYQPRYQRHGLGNLIALGLVRPGPGYLLVRTHKIALRRTIEDHHDTIEQVIAHSAKTTALTAETANIARYGLATMIATTGKPLPEITVEDWVTVERTRSDLMAPYRDFLRAAEQASKQSLPALTRPDGLISPDRLYSLRWAYTACARAKVVAPHPNPPLGMPPVPVNLDTALAKPRTIQSLLEAQEDVITGRLYDLAVLVFDEHYASHDFNSKRGVTGYLGAYLRAVDRVLPAHGSLRIPRQHATAIVEQLSQRTDQQNSGSTSPREGVAAVLQLVRRFYDYALETVEEYEEYRDLVGPFPVSTNAVSALAKKYHKQARSNMNSNIRSAITTIDDLVPAAEHYANHVIEFVEQATQTPAGETFTFRNVEYVHHATPVHPDSRAVLHVRPVESSHGPTDLLLARHRAVRLRALITTLRHTGIRREEAGEIARDDLGFSRIDGANVPCLQVGPAKTDTSRTIPMHSDMIKAYVDLVRSFDTLYGEVPLAVRRDTYERTSLPPRRYLFQTNWDGSFVAPDLSTLTNWVSRFVEDYNAIARVDGMPLLKPLRPHDYRRLFATDLLDKEVSIESVRHLMGHTNVATTAVYDHTTWERAAAKFIDSHRGTDQPRRTGLAVPCPTCHGTGRVDA